jgi:hypothetical protein
MLLKEQDASPADRAGYLRDHSPVNPDTVLTRVVAWFREQYV